MRRTTDNELRNLRRAYGMTQQELADVAGISRGAVSHIERGRRKPTLDVLRVLAMSLECTPLDICPWLAER